MSPRQKTVILDIDPGTDDAWAALLLFNNENRCNFKIKAITCVFGNSTIDNIGKNVLRLLKIADRLDIPVYLGCSEPLVTLDPKNKIYLDFHGKNGWCDVELNMIEPDFNLIQKKHAILAMHDIISKEENVTVMCLGPLTNLAMLYKQYPETSKKIKDIFIMGGNRFGVGNITSAAEFNFYCDPEAAFIVLQSSPCLINLLPLETMHNSDQIPKSWRFGTLGRIKNEVTRVMNLIEEKAYEKLDEWGPYDMYCAAAFIEPAIVQKEQLFHMTVELNGLLTRGQCVIDHLKKNEANVRVIEKMDVEKLKSLAMDTMKAQKNMKFETGSCIVIVCYKHKHNRNENSVLNYLKEANGFCKP